MNYLILSIIVVLLSFQTRAFASFDMDTNTALAKLISMLTRVKPLTLMELSDCEDLLNEFNFGAEIEERLLGIFNQALIESICSGKTLMELTQKGSDLIFKFTESSDQKKPNESVAITLTKVLG